VTVSQFFVIAKVLVYLTDGLLPWFNPCYWALADSEGLRGERTKKLERDETMLKQPQQGSSREPDETANQRGEDPTIFKLERELTRLSRLLIAAKSKLRYKLERAHYAILSMLEDSGPQPIGKIAHFLLLDNSTATRQVTAMENLGLVKRFAHPTDQRSRIIGITPRGRSLMQEMQAIRNNHLSTWLSDWSSKELRDFASLLHAYNEVLVDRLDR
jgi:DNA-binding MarR family transcriptional regulator